MISRGSRVEGSGFTYLAQLNVGEQEGCIHADYYGASTISPPEDAVSSNDQEGNSTMLVAIVSTLIVVIFALIIAVVGVMYRRSRRQLGLTTAYPTKRNTAVVNNRYRHNSPKKNRKMQHLGMIPPEMLHQSKWANNQTLSPQKQNRRNAVNAYDRGSPVTDLDQLVPPIILEEYPVPSNYGVARKMEPAHSTLPSSHGDYQRVAPQYVPPRSYQELTGARGTKIGKLANGGPAGFAHAWGEKPKHRSSGLAFASSTPVEEPSTYDEPSLMEFTDAGQNML
jgi:hypothetical protein